jgi:hypothetical protein
MAYRPSNAENARYVLIFSIIPAQAGITEQC